VVSDGLLLQFLIDPTYVVIFEYESYFSNVTQLIFNILTLDDRQIKMPVRHARTHAALEWQRSSSSKALSSAIVVDEVA